MSYPTSGIHSYALHCNPRPKQQQSHQPAPVMLHLTVPLDQLTPAGGSADKRPHRRAPVPLDQQTPTGGAASRRPHRHMCMSLEQPTPTGGSAVRRPRRRVCMSLEQLTLTGGSAGRRPRCRAPTRRQLRRPTPAHLVPDPHYLRGRGRGDTTFKFWVCNRPCLIVTADPD